MGLTKEVIEHIQKTTQNQARTELMLLPGDARNQVRYRQGETVGQFSIENPPESLTLERLQDVVELAEKWNENGLCVVVYYNQHSIQVNGYETDNDGDVISDALPNLAIMPLRGSSEYGFFLDRHGSPHIGMREFRRELLTRISKCPQEKKLLGIVSSLRRFRADDTHASISNGQESLGNSVTDELRSTVEQPDELQVFNVLRWANADLPIRFPIECLLCTDMSDGPQWYLYPYEWSLEEFKKRSLDFIDDFLTRELEKSHIAIHRGSWAEQSRWTVNDFLKVEAANRSDLAETEEKPKRVRRIDDDDEY